MSNGSFRIVEKLSESATTAVYRADHLTLGRTVLLKVLHRHLASDPEFSERFTREARACAQLRSPHVVQVFDLTEIDGSPAIVMEFVEGRSLKQLLADEGPQPHERVRTMATELLVGLTAAHERGIIHRDLKPGNILITSTGSVKITDFGLAAVLTANSITQEGAVLGTPAYMSPEQSRGETLDARTDLFSLGVTLVELLTGQRIFDGESYAECLRKISTFKPEHLKKILPEIPDSFERILERLLAPNPDRRFASAGEVLDVLENRIPLPPARVRTMNAHVRAAILAAAVVVVLVAVLYALFFRDRPSESSLTESPSGIVADSLTPSGHQDSSHDEPQPRLGATVPATVSPTRMPDVGSADKRRQPSEVTTRDSGALRISAKPWARVSVNGREVGDTPLASPVRVAAGSNSVTFTFNNFTPITRVVDVQPDETIAVDADFMQVAGYVSIQATPWAYVYVDGQYCDVTPFHTPLIVPIGSRSIRFQHPSLGEVTRLITVAQGETLRVVVDLRQQANHVPR
jgi:serine/threonine-protein kinase